MEKPSVFESSEERQKTFSQEVARFFELINYPFLFIEIPIVALAIFYFLLLVLLCLLWGMWLGLLFISAGLFSFLGLYLLRCLLFIGYYRHSRGRLREEKIKWLWLGTIFFNIMLMGVVIYGIHENAPSFDLMSLGFWIEPINRIFVFFFVWLIVICALSVVSLFDDYS